MSREIIDRERVCARRGCKLLATKGWGDSLYCVEHCRFHRLRAASKRRGKAAPSMEWLESNIPDPFICPHCNHALVWEASEGRSRVLTIQHDHNGTIRFLCQGCNTRHWRIPEDGFYKGKLDEKFCSRCTTWKSLAMFHKGDGYMGRSSMCRDCDNKRVSARRRAHGKQVKS